MPAQLLMDHGCESFLEGFLYILGFGFLFWEIESSPSLFIVSMSIQLLRWPYSQKWGTGSPAGGLTALDCGLVIRFVFCPVLATYFIAGN